MGQHDPVTYKYFLLKLQNRLFRKQVFFRGTGPADHLL